MSRFRGTGVALVTPFNTDKSVDYPSLTTLINHCIDGGVEFLVSLGTTGESVTLNAQEKQAVIKHTKECIKGRVPLVVGMGGNNTEALITEIKAQNFEGIDAILSVSPYYSKPTQAGIYGHFAAIAQACPVDIILYNVPGRTSSNMTSKTTVQLAKDFENIVAVKEASGDLEQCMEIVANKPNGFNVLSGDDLLAMPQMCVGMDGVISVIANAYPKAFSDMVRYGLNGENENARNLHYKLMPMIQWLFADGNPGGVKCVLHKLDICNNELRLPLVKVNDDVKAALYETADALN